ncbi:Phosphoinositide phospholipase C [Bertholletia excelsa]
MPRGQLEQSGPPHPVSYFSGAIQRRTEHVFPRNSNSRSLPLSLWNSFPFSKMTSKQTYKRAPADIKALFDQYSENGVMNVDHLRRFLIEVQKEENATESDAQAIIDSFPPSLPREGTHLEPSLITSSATQIPSFHFSPGLTFWFTTDIIFSFNWKCFISSDMTAPLDCSDAPIIQALQRGVRVIELDIGRIPLKTMTLTTPVELLKCLKSIKEHAFTASEYPVVVTLEDHLTPDLQAKVAEEKDDPQKGKNSNDEEAWGKKPMLIYEFTIAQGDLDEDKDDEDEDEDDDKDGNNKSQQKGGLQDWLQVDPNKVRRLSLSELELEKAVVTHGKEIVRFTRRNLLRVYPKGIRFDSSNYNPLIGWMHGAQMVAFNMQGYGRSLWLMHGMFRANGGCGYVTVYMGEGWYHDFPHTHFDAYSPPDFYARVGIAGVPADVVMKKTKTLEDNWVPDWNETFEFPLTVPELALLRIEVHEYDMSEKDDFVPLHSQKGEKYKSVKLLMRFEFV